MLLPKLILANAGVEDLLCCSSEFLPYVCIPGRTPHDG